MADRPHVLHRLFGGAPIAVLLRLAVVSILIGAVMAGFGLTPDNIVQHLADAGRYVWDYGLGGLQHVAGYALTGAVIVVPIWLILRVTGRG